MYHGIDYLIHLPSEPLKYGWLTWTTLVIGFVVDGGVLYGAIKDVIHEKPDEYGGFCSYFGYWYVCCWYTRISIHTKPGI